MHNCALSAALSFAVQKLLPLFSFQWIKGDTTFAYLKTWSLYPAPAEERGYQVPMVKRSYLTHRQRRSPKSFPS